MYPKRDHRSLLLCCDLAVSGQGYDVFAMGIRSPSFEKPQTNVAAATNAQVSSKCQSGFKAAVDMNCYDACANGGYLQPFVSERRLNEVCNGALKETPRPLCHDACVRGYRSGVKDMTTLLVKRMAEVRRKNAVCKTLYISSSPDPPTCQPGSGVQAT